MTKEMNYMREYKVLRNGSLWTDRFDSIVLAEVYIQELLLDGDDSDFEIEEMTKEEIAQYYI